MSGELYLLGKVITGHDLDCLGRSVCYSKYTLGHRMETILQKGRLCRKVETFSSTWELYWMNTSMWAPG